MTKCFDNFRKCVSNPPSPPYTILPTNNIAWHKFCSLFLNIVKRRKRTDEIVQIAVFPIAFVPDCLKICKFLSLVFYYCLFEIKLKACIYPLRHFYIGLNSFWNLNKQLKYLGKWSKILIFQKFLSQNQVFRNSTRCAIVHEIVALET